MPSDRKHVEMPVKPNALKVESKGIPDELKKLRQWVAWRYRRKGDGWTKLPICCLDGRTASCADPATWVEFDLALDYYRREGADGIGFVFTPEDDFCGVDLDKCRDPDSGDLQDWASTIIYKMASYTEISPSGTGVKIFLRGSLPKEKGRRKGGIEVYDQGRYFAMTGRHLPYTSPSLEEPYEELFSLYSHLGDEEDDDCGPTPNKGLTDDQVLRKASSAKNGDKFDRLMAGDIHDYPSKSEADLALCSILVHWAGNNLPQIERLFNRSKLANRDKWRDGQYYRELTIKKSLHRGATSMPTRPTNDSVSTRIIQDSQELTGSISTDVGEKNANANLSHADGERGLQIALEVAEAEGDLSDWQSMFTLARRLRSLAGEACPNAFQFAVQAFCQSADKPVEDYWYAFLDCWDKVKMAEGENLIEWAANMAKKSPAMTPTTSLDQKYALIGSIAYHLGEFRKPKPFWLPGNMIAPFLDMNERTVYRIISLLEKNKVIRCVDADSVVSGDPES